MSRMHANKDKETAAKGGGGLNKTTCPVPGCEKECIGSALTNHIRKDHGVADE